MKGSERATREIEHGRYLAEGDTEALWGWGTPAGRRRAANRASRIALGARLGPGIQALEIGCGTGMFTEIFASAGASILAVDISEALLVKARARSLPEDRVRFLARRFEDCGVLGPFDAVIGSSILHHLEMNEAIPRIFELLKPGGLMSFAEPNLLNPQVFAERRFRRYFPYVSPDETAFVRWPLRKELERAGFVRVEIVPFDWLHPSVPTPLVGIVSGLARVLEILPGIRELAGSLVIEAARPA